MGGSFGANPACSGPDPRLAALLDGELSPQERQQLMAHARRCSRCAADLAQQRAVRAVLWRTGTALLPPRDLRARLQVSLAQAQPHASRRRWLLLAGGLAAAIALLTVISLIWWPGQEPSAALLVRAGRAHERQTLGSAPVTFASADASAVSAWAYAQTGGAIDVPSLASVGYALLGARLEPDVAPGAVSLVYMGADGRLTCTLVPATEPAWMRLPLVRRSSAVHVAQIGGFALASWSEEETAYIMVADLPPSALLELARLASQMAFALPAPKNL